MAYRAKRLNEMDDLFDMGRFPTKIYVGATGNILQTILITYVLQGRFKNTPALLAWVLTVIPLNLLPVIWLRRELNQTTVYPLIEEMNFMNDQHKFASWVYAVASANMMFWIVLAWAAFSYKHNRRTLLMILALTFICTFFPAWKRLFK